MKARAHDPDANHWPAEPSIRQTSEAYSKQFSQCANDVFSFLPCPAKLKCPWAAQKCGGAHEIPVHSMAWYRIIPSLHWSPCGFA